MLVEDTESVVPVATLDWEGRIGSSNVDSAPGDALVSGCRGLGLDVIGQMTTVSVVTRVVVWVFVDV